MSAHAAKLLGRIGPCVTIAAICVLSGWPGGWVEQRVYGAQTLERQLSLSSASAGAGSVTYRFSFNLVTAGTLGSIEFEFCSNSSLIGEPCDAPVGLSALNAVLAGQTGQAGFHIAGNSTVNDLILSRAAAAAIPGQVSYTFNAMANPASAGSYYARVLTYASTDGSGTATDAGGFAFAIANGVDVNAVVPPFLLFCTGVTVTGNDCGTASGDYVDLGQLGADHTSDATTQMLVATNAQNGYSLYVNGTTMTSGNNVIPAVQEQLSAEGVSQFGLNLRANTVPQAGQDPQGPGQGVPTTPYAQPDRFSFTNGQAIAGSPAPENYRTYTASYIVNVSKSQPAGVYTTTLTYVGLANF